MKAAGMFVSFLLIVDTFFVSYAIGFNSRHVLVVDPSLKPVEPPKQEQTVEPAKDKPAAATHAADKDKKASDKKTGAKSNKHGTKDHKPDSTKKVESTKKVDSTKKANKK